MIRPVTLCILLTVATLCHGDDGVADFDNAAARNTHGGPFADASPAELQQLLKIDEAAKRVLAKYLSHEFDTYEARITQLEDELARRSKPRSQPRYATPAQVPTPVSPYQPTRNHSPYAAPARFTDPKSTPSPAQPERLQAQQPSPTSSPAAPSTPAKARQRFNFNGQWFYIIPVEHVNASTPSQAQ
jgi:hypothetical protein